MTTTTIPNAGLPLTALRVRRIAERINAALAAIEAEEGVRLHCGGGTFQADNAKLNLTVTVVRPDGSVRDLDAERFTRERDLHGLASVDLGARFVFKNQIYAVSGLASRRGGNPVFAKRTSDGRVYRFPASLVLDLVTAARARGVA
jgi:hypothetical protein